jgi:hypothetical protein
MSDGGWLKDIPFEPVPEGQPFRYERGAPMPEFSFRKVGEGKRYTAAFERRIMEQERQASRLEFLQASFYGWEDGEIAYIDPDGKEPNRLVSEDLELMEKLVAVVRAHYGMEAG